MRNQQRILCGVLLVGLSTIALGALQVSVAEDRDERPWSFQPVRSTNVPAVLNKVRNWSPVDAFVLSSLEACGVGPAPIADRRTLIRRVTFDLTGLPPTVEELDMFLNDDAPDAFAKVVDRLLASPSYGERWGRHWLDVVRYADARDLIQLPAESDFREAWRYRDWVVAAFNRDTPYDQFVRLQIAGDLMQPRDTKRIDAEALVATGFLAIADFVPGDVDKQQMIADYVNDQIDVVGRAVLGLTLACARCHDHKFDPISIEDYYSLAGIFFSTRLVPGPVKGNTPLVRAPLLSPPELAAIEAAQARDKVRLVELTREIGQMGEQEYRDYLQRQVASDTPRYLLAAWEYVSQQSEAMQPTPADFAKNRGLEASVLTRWVAYLNEKSPHSVVATLRRVTDKPMAEVQAREVATAIARIATERRQKESRQEVGKLAKDSAFLRFRADDRQTITSNTNTVVGWPNRGRLLAAATPVADVAAPELTTTVVHGRDRTVLRFAGDQLLQIPLSATAVGSLFVVFRPNPAGPGGQRLIGWEDSAVGQHGLGIMTDGAGAIQAILRRNGVGGDVSVPAPISVPAAPEFQILCVSWGPQGVVVHRQGREVGTNNGIDSISSDSNITSLRIGGPGSGASPRFHGDLAELRLYQMPLDEQARTQVEAELTERWCTSTEDIGNVDPVEDLYDELISTYSPFRLEGAERDKALPDDFQARLANLRGELEALQKKKPAEIPQAVVVQDGGPIGTPHEGFHDAHVYLRGNHEKPGGIVSRGFPRILAGAEPVGIREGSGRRELSVWLTSADNPLTARVMVNRIWQHHFGVGLVPTSTNFGAMGEPPSHPELLDYLAARFVQTGWSIKSLHRLLLLSSLYQPDSAPNVSSSAIDPENRLLWRANRRRLESEALRDSLFFVAGKLDLTPGGVGFQDVANPRRSLYLMSVRTGAKSAEFGPLFDAADCSGIVERRNESIVAPQALFLMNDPLVTVLASAVASRVEVEVSEEDLAARIRHLYEITLGRLPTDAEMEIGQSFLANQGQGDNWARYCRLILSTNEFLFVD